MEGIRPRQRRLKPFKLKFGEMVYWDGNTCIHGNKINNTDITRISFDFRVFFKDKYEKYISTQIKLFLPLLQWEQIFSGRVL